MEPALAREAGCEGGGRGVPMKDDEQLSTILEPDIMVPEQFFAGPRRGEERGEHRLMAAILDDAVLTYCMSQVARARGGWRAEREAGEWIESTDRSWIFSFERICDALDLDAECIRRGVRAWKQRSGRTECWVRPGAARGTSEAPTAERRGGLRPTRCSLARRERSCAPSTGRRHRSGPSNAGL